MSQITLTQMWKEHDEDSTEEYSDTSIDNGAPKIGYDSFDNNDEKEQIT